MPDQRIDLNPIFGRVSPKLTRGQKFLLPSPQRRAPSVQFAYGEPRRIDMCSALMQVPNTDYRCLLGKNSLSAK
jgi:hypothetical protein